ncbi:PucR family transcriptional regulator, partial [Saccharomonospora iraqiensis]|uniref:PucR family transcriptional regulator n=1 Tax=Saccharomonospora iraqiensis TaxID=52698 RepID=UPI00022E6107
ALREALRRRVLDPLDGHPDLARTVRVFLEHSASPTRTARALRVHVNTVRYRLARAGELLGADLTDFRTQVDLYLALSVDP